MMSLTLMLTSDMVERLLTQNTLIRNLHRAVSEAGAGLHHWHREAEADDEDEVQGCKAVGHLTLHLPTQNCLLTVDHHQKGEGEGEGEGGGGGGGE